MALVQYRISHILHIEGGGVAENHPQDQSGDYQNLPEGLVLPDGQQFFPADIPDLLTK